MIFRRLEFLTQYTCPQCLAEVPVPEGQAPNVLECPACGTEFIPIVDEPEATAQSKPGEGDDPEAELNQLRIRQVIALRRGAYRSRSYCIVATAGLVFAGVELVRLGAGDWRGGGFGVVPAVYLAVACAALCAAWFFAARAWALTLEVRQTALADPIEPPDFAPLNDGSQHVKHLEEM